MPSHVGLVKIIAANLTSIYEINMENIGCPIMLWYQLVTINSKLMK